MFASLQCPASAAPLVQLTEEMCPAEHGHILSACMQIVCAFSCEFAVLMVKVERRPEGYSLRTGSARGYVCKERMQLLVSACAVVAGSRPVVPP